MEGDAREERFRCVFSSTSRRTITSYNLTCIGAPAGGGGERKYRLKQIWRRGDKLVCWEATQLRLEVIGGFYDLECSTLRWQRESSLSALWPNSQTGFIPSHFLCK